MVLWSWEFGHIRNVSTIMSNLKVLNVTFQNLKVYKWILSTTIIGVYMNVIVAFTWFDHFVRLLKERTLRFFQLYLIKRDVLCTIFIAIIFFPFLSIFSRGGMRLEDGNKRKILVELWNTNHMPFYHYRMIFYDSIICWFNMKNNCQSL